MKQILEIEMPFTAEMLETGYNGKVLKYGNYHIIVSKNRGLPPWIVDIGEGIFEDGEMGITHIVNRLANINSDTQPCVDLINNIISKNCKFSREAKIAKKIFCEFKNR